MKTEILIIGDEILNGETQDTNSRFIARQLSQMGLFVNRITTTADHPQAISEALGEVLSRADLVLTTGGLGPTHDDITATALAGFFNCEMIFNEAVYSSIKARFEKRNKPVNPLSRQQAFIPQKARPIINPVGTAPALWFEEAGKIVVALPGVPSETEFLVEHHIMPLLRSKLPDHYIRYHKLFFTGIGESDLAPMLAEIQATLPRDVTVAYLPGLGYVKIRITASGDDKERISSALSEVAGKMKSVASQYYFGENEDNFARMVSRGLITSQKTVSAAESCTGGYLAHQLTSIPGCSAYFKGSCVAYHNEVKQNVLGVKAETLEKYGAVSEPTVREMVLGALRIFDSDIALATSGIAGPAGGSEGKPVGTVFIGAGTKDHVEIREFHFNKDRMQNIILSANMALIMLKPYLNIGK
ncbi:MAG: competence/damage-inducible protein A [Bacteroidia bacterium]